MRRAQADLDDEALYNELLLLNHGNKKKAEKALARILIKRREYKDAQSDT